MRREQAVAIGIQPEHTDVVGLRPPCRAWSTCRACSTATPCGIQLPVRLAQPELAVGRAGQGAAGLARMYMLSSASARRYMAQTTAATRPVVAAIMPNSRCRTPGAPPGIARPTEAGGARHDQLGGARQPPERHDTAQQNGERQDLQHVRRAAAAGRWWSPGRTTTSGRVAARRNSSMIVEQHDQERQPGQHGEATAALNWRAI